MGILKALVKGAADGAHTVLASLIELGLNPSQTHAGALIIVDNAKQNILLRETASFHGGEYHIEQDLLSKLYDFSVQQGQAFKLPNNCRVYFYVYNSPCQKCTQTLRISLGNWRAKNPTVIWKLGFSVYYLLPKANGYNSVQEAANDYMARIVGTGANISMKQLSA